jgi:hypothetical protein
LSDENEALVRRHYEEILNERNLETLAGFQANEQMVEPVRRGCFSDFTSFPDLHCSVDEVIDRGRATGFGPALRARLPGGCGDEQAARAGEGGDDDDRGAC